MDPRIRIRAALRCDGIGRLDCAEDAESGGRLAVRWLPLDANGDAAVKACARLPEHPRLPRIRQTGQVGGSAFVAMDFPEGALLSTRAGERLEVDAVIRLGSQLSSALATVHAQGVVHGEMSTDSVLLVEPDHAYLWDMPLVIANRLTDRRGENRLMQNLVKTAPFLAPERARGDGASQASDVYSLGAVLCIAAGAPMPTASTTLGVVHQVALGEWTPRVPMVLPDPYRSMLARMVSVDPVQRPSADEVALVFAELPPPAALPTVPEFPVVKLPPELLAAADALLRRPSVETPKVPSEPGLSRENPVPAGVNLGAVTAEARALSGQVPAVQAPVDELSTADTLKRGAVARAEATPEVTTKASTSGPTAAAAVAATASKDTSPATATKASASGPTAAAAVAVAATKASTSGPTAAAAVTAKASTSGPTAAAEAGLAVQLRDNLSVSHELAQAGAAALSDEEVAALQRSRRQVILVAAGLGGAILALLTVAFLLATSHAEPPVAPTPRPAVVVPAPAKTPAVAAPAGDDELAPLPALPATSTTTSRRMPVPAKAPAPAPAKAAKAVESPEPVASDVSASASASDDTVTPAPTSPSDFEFLESADAPKGELKRPSW